MICRIPRGFPIPFMGRPYPIHELNEKGEIPWEAYVFVGHHEDKHVIPDPTNDKTGRVLNIFA